MFHINTVDTPKRNIKTFQRKLQTNKLKLKNSTGQSLRKLKSWKRNRSSSCKSSQRRKELSINEMNLRSERKQSDKVKTQMQQMQIGKMLMSMRRTSLIKMVTSTSKKTKQLSQRLIRTFFNSLLSHRDLLPARCIRKQPDKKEKLWLS